MRGLFRFLVVIALIAGGVLVALKMYLHSDAVTGQVARRLQDALGVPVTVGGIELGSSRSAATNIAIFESGATPGQSPFVAIGRANTDIGISDFLKGEIDPKKLDIEDVNLTLRYDRDGRLLTRLPTARGPSQPLPEFQLQRASIKIIKEGDADCEFRGIDGLIKETSDAILLQGQVNDPAWGGSWAVQGAFPKLGGIGRLELKNNGLHVNQAMLHRVPFVSENVWRHVGLEGDTPVQVLLSLPQPPARVGYRVVLSPKNTRVHVPSIDLTATAAQGQVVVENNVVMLREVRGKVADGDLHLTSAELDYRNPATVMKFHFDARRLDIRKLPASWKLPPRLAGRLSGTANLIVRMIDGLAIPMGSGDGLVEYAMFGPIPVPSYGLRIKADRDGFSFEPRLGQ